MARDRHDRQADRQRGLFGRDDPGLTSRAAAGLRAPTLNGRSRPSALDGGDRTRLVEGDLRAFPKDWRPAPVVLIQHIDAALAPGLAHWLTEQTGHEVAVASEGAVPGPGQVLLAATNDHLVVEQGRRRVRYVSEPRDYCYRPSVDVFFASVAAHWPGRGVAALLTGMGRDGATGLLTLRRTGWFTVAQDEATSVVWGMPRAAVEVGAADEVLPLRKIGPMIVERVHHILRDDEVHS